jgi:hypothetical protein
MAAQAATASTGTEGSGAAAAVPTAAPGGTTPGGGAAPRASSLCASAPALSRRGGGASGGNQPSAAQGAVEAPVGEGAAVEALPVGPSHMPCATLLAVCTQSSSAADDCGTVARALGLGLTNAVARATVHALCTRPTTGAHLGFTLALTHVEFKQIAA